MEPGKQQENNCKNRKIPELNISAQYPENGRMYRLRGCAAGFRVFRPATGAGLAGPFAGNLMVAWLSCQSGTNCSKCPTGLVGQRYEIVVAWLSR